jgi:DNA polymerase (family X)
MNKELIKILNKLSSLLLLKGENIFKARAYTNAAQIIKEQNIDVVQAVKDNTLASIKGFGKALQEKITDYVVNGEMQYYKKLLAEIPAGLIEINSISLIGPKKARELFYSHNIKSLADLEDAAKSGMLVKIKGFSIKSTEMILNSIQHKKASRGRFLMHTSHDSSQKLMHLIKSLQSVEQASLTSINRRFAETIDTLNFIVATNDPHDLTKHLKSEFFPEYQDNMITGRTSSDIPIRITISSPDEYVWKLHESTGSEQYIKSFHDLIKKQGIRIEGNDLFQHNEKITLKSEDQLYQLADIQYVEPELRERPEILELAGQKKIPELIKPDDLKGMVHVHTNWSDGVNTVREMALSAKELGFSYIVICDHSRTATYTNGLSIERVADQQREIDLLNEEGLGIQILKGIESDILSDGSLDYPDNILQTFDIVIASVHSQFNMSERDMSKRISYALMSPYTTMLGHPTGRLLLAREQYPLNIEEIIKVAADHGKIIEINANPYRLDLSWENAMKAKEMGVRISINPDSHDTYTMKEVFFGVKLARKAGLSKEDVVNCLNYNDFVKNIVNK